MFDETRQAMRDLNAAAYAPLLEPGEVLLANGLIARAFIGENTIEVPPGQTDRMLAQAQEVIDRALAPLDRLPPLPKGFIAVAGVIGGLATGPNIGPSPERLLGGRTGHGGLGSLASLFAAGSDAVDVDLAVTDRRVGLTRPLGPIGKTTGDTREPRQLRWEVVVPREAVLGVRRRRRPLEWGRLEFAFRDGSSITLTAGIISGRRADRLLAALTSPAGPGAVPS